MRRNFSAAADWIWCKAWWKICGAAGRFSGLRNMNVGLILIPNMHDDVFIHKISWQMDVSDKYFQILFCHGWFRFQLAGLVKVCRVWHLLFLLIRFLSIRRFWTRFLLFSFLVIVSAPCLRRTGSPVGSGPPRFDPVRSGPVRSGRVRSGQVRSGPVRSGLVQPSVQFCFCFRIFPVFLDFRFRSELFQLLSFRIPVAMVTSPPSPPSSSWCLSWCVCRHEADYYDHLILWI